MYDVLNFEQNISNLSLDILSNLLKIISKQIIKLGGKPTEIMKIDISLVDLEKQRWANGLYVLDVSMMAEDIEKMVLVKKIKQYNAINVKNVWKLLILWLEHFYLIHI